MAMTHVSLFHFFNAIVSQSLWTQPWRVRFVTGMDFGMYLLLRHCLGVGECRAIVACSSSLLSKLRTVHGLPWNFTSHGATLCTILWHLLAIFSTSFNSHCCKRLTRASNPFCLKWWQKQWCDSWSHANGASWCALNPPALPLATPLALPNPLLKDCFASSELDLRLLHRLRPKDKGIT